MFQLIQKIFGGNKSQRDIKEIMPLIEESKLAYEKISQLTNDELREKTSYFKQCIKDATKDLEDRVQEIKNTIQRSELALLDLEDNSEVTEKDRLSPNQKEDLYNQIDKLEKEIYEITQAKLTELLPEAFAVVKSTAERFSKNEEVEVRVMPWDQELATSRESVNIRGEKAYYKNSWMAGGALVQWNMVHYDVQLIGGTVLHQGKIAEMGTGEGKTLVATLPIYLNALSGRGVHVVTVNDYLAKRDSEWMGMLFEFHGLKVDCIDKHQPNSESRRNAYLADVTYGTNNEFGFDYLRDNMCRNPQELVQRKHNYAIVDEVDSVLIDDARTPLIISGPTYQGDKQEFDVLKPQIEKIFNAQKSDMTKVLAEAKALLSGEPSKENREKGAKLLLRAYRGLPKNKALIKFLSEPGMKALLTSVENDHMADQNKKMPEIDEHLLFVIEEKQNSIDLTDKGVEFLSEGAGDAKYFVLPDIGSEIADLERLNLSDDEKTERKNEIMRNYAVISERVHTLIQLLKAYTLFEKDVEYVVIDNEVKIVDEQTGRIMDGRRYSDGLHQAIEAKENVKIEAATQTYATITLQNYFRMYSKLSGMTGTAETEAGELWNIYKLEVVSIPTNRPVIRMDREDLVYKTKREKYKAIIDEINTLVEQGRPVLVGTTSVEISELLSRMLKQLNIKHNVLNAKLHKREADIVAEAGASGAVTIATNMAGRGTDIKLGEGVKDAGGLAIIGTERHESRRVDRQLRGRSGRQGDPGSSQFFVSLEDDLMRLFATHRIAGLMDKLGHKEGDVIQHSMITKSIERAQRKVEENNFGIRKRLLEYDDVMNSQREVIYRKRRHALYGERLSLDVENMMLETLDKILSEQLNARDIESFNLEVIRTFGVDPHLEEKQFLNAKPDDILWDLFDKINASYLQKTEKIALNVLHQIKEIKEREGNRYENIAVPITDGKKVIQVIVNIQNAIENKGNEVMKGIQKSVCLAVIDDAWKEHLREMDDLKQSVQNATYEQKDPLLIYKLEAFGLFKTMIENINREISSFLCLGQLPHMNEQFKEGREQSTDLSHMKISRESEAPQTQGNRTQEVQKTQPVHVEKKIGRNDLCPCGSGKKYKNCHG